ncbi:MAG: CRTAC1 family protein, partial [Verrucomicrobiota bacterium]
GDIDGDGASDLVLGGPKGKPTRVFKNNFAKGSGASPMVAIPNPALVAHQASEDMGLLLLEADGDGDLDLYVASGSNEARRNDPAYGDRLYLNDGKGNFTHADQALPDSRESSSTVTAADYDRDGDLDLFIGVRQLIGEYPNEATSQLLQNDGNGNFEDVTFKVAPSLLRDGLVTSAVWTDLNESGFQDLIIAQDNGEIKVLINDGNGLLENKSSLWGTDKSRGFWNAVAASDIDADGDIDLIASNLGLNTPYQASEKNPFTALMPAGTEDAGLTELATTLFLNEDSKLRPIALPLLVQSAPCYGIAISDVNGDGLQDVYFQQNLTAVPEGTAPFNAGTSVLLYGTGDPEALLLPTLPSRTGLLAPEQGRSLSVCDFNNDRRPDFFAGYQGAHPSLYFNEGKQGFPFSVQLQGTAGNPTAVGARVIVEISQFPTQVDDVTAGSGYLSQEDGTLLFSAPSSKVDAAIQVQWPDGETTAHDVEIGSGRVKITR